jgi:two-component system, cell cycle sensor histidine kinase and response regulator CckA
MRSATVHRPLILVVDDEEALVGVICGYLSAQGYDVVGATTGPQAVAVAKDRIQSLSLVIMDVLLEDALGTDVVEELLALRQDLRVIYLSGHAQDEAIYTSSSKLPLAMIQKPCPLPRLASVVENMMGVQW